MDVQDAALSLAIVLAAFSAYSWWRTEQHLVREREIVREQGRELYRLKHPEHVKGGCDE